METVDTSKRLAKLRDLMKERKVDFYIVPSEDSHKSEFIAPCDARREHISGFSGSSGCAVVGLEKAALATDGRYFNQAGKQLDSNWTLLKQGLEDVPTWQEWTVEQAEGGKTVGVDPTLLSAPEARRLAKSIKDKSAGSLVGIGDNLVDLVWGSDRPPKPTEKVMLLDHKYAGKSFADKVEDLRKELEKKKCLGFVVSMLDDIAWLFNLRGNDIPFNPVFFSYAVVTPTDVALYVDSEKLTDQVKSYLGDKVSIKPYNTVFSDLKALSEPASNAKDDKSSVKRKFAISGKGSWALSLELGGEDQVNEIRSPISDAKAVKNETELEGMRACHVRDGAALSEFFAWLEDMLVAKKKTLDEVQVADKLEEIRKKKEHFVGLSFPTISSTGPNAAVIHYQPERGNCSIVKPESIFLCDSGAQYLDGTTDTTRTLHFGNPTAMEIKSYTLVLKGVIALDTTIFPKGTTGYALDAFARQFLWKQGLNYRHGTGHGVGSFLNVHEGPIGIGHSKAYADVQLSAGNVISDEPGYYEDSKFGIRIENVIMARETKDLPHSFGEKPWLCFEHVTMVPMCRKLIDTELLTQEEKTWLNTYHREVWEKTEGHLAGKGDGSGDGESGIGRRWLWRETRPI